MSGQDELRAAVLVCKPLAQILTFWRPGSHDTADGPEGANLAWTWAHEYADLVADPVTAAVRTRIDEEGFGFIDHLSPVLLGSDGRVWDGHHRIIIAIQRGVSSLMVEVAGHPDAPAEVDAGDVGGLTEWFRHHRPEGGWGASAQAWIDLQALIAERERKAAERALREAAEWLVQVGYPFDFNFTPRAPEALWQAVVDVVHEDADGNLHGNDLTREQVAEWLVDP